MATIKFRGMVHEIDGLRLRVSERQRKKLDDGSWETSGYTDFTVWLAERMPYVQPKMLVDVEGFFRREERTSGGREFVNLIVSNAKAVAVPRDGEQPAAEQSDGGWPTATPGGDPWSSAAQQDGGWPA